MAQPLDLSWAEFFPLHDGMIWVLPISVKGIYLQPWDLIFICVFSWVVSVCSSNRLQVASKFMPVSSLIIGEYVG